MKAFCREAVVFGSVLAAAGCLGALAVCDGAMARGGRHQRDGGDSSSGYSAPSSSFAPQNSNSQGSDTSQNSSSSQTGTGSSANDDTKQQQDSSASDEQKRGHRHRHRQGNDDNDDDSTSSTASQNATEGTANQAQGQGQGSGDGARKAAAGPAAGQPPRTIEELFKHWFNGNGPQPAAAQTKTERAPVALQERTARDRAGVAAEAAKAKTVKVPGRAPPPVVTEFPAAEILVPKLSADGLKRAETLGFTDNGKVTLTQSSSMARLLAPPGVGAEHALAMLNDALPGQQMGVNERYRLFKSASEPTDGSPAPMPTPCGTDKCFGSNLIGWRPQLQTCARKAKIGVIDTSIDTSHPTFKKRQIELRPKALARVHRNDPVAPNWHGTGVLSILAGEPQSGTPGLIPDGRFLLADVFYADSSGLPVSDTASLVEALDWLELKHADIINMSLTGPHDELLQAAVERLSRKGVLIVAAVGNDGPNAPPTFPSAYAQVLAVTAINKDLSSYTYAVHGSHVDVAAPGVRIWTAMPGGKATYQSGTSFAAPYATAVAASIYPALATKTKTALLQKMSFVDLGAPGRDPIYGQGLVIAPYACPGDTDTPVASEPPPAAAFVTTVSTAGGKPMTIGGPTSPSAGR